MSETSILQKAWLRSTILVLVIAALMLIIWESDEPTQPILESDAQAAEADGFVIGGTYLSFGPEGNLSSRFSSERIEQYETERRIEMQAPRALLFIEGTGEPWKIEAARGTFLQDEGIIRLEGDVYAEHQRAPTLDPTVMKTASLNLDNDQRTVYTNEAVEISDPIGITRAEGMKAWIDRRILELNNAVEGHYDLRKR